MSKRNNAKLTVYHFWIKQNNFFFFVIWNIYLRLADNCTFDNKAAHWNDTFANSQQNIGWNIKP